MNREAARFWDAAPCGTRAIEAAAGSPAFFSRIEQERLEREPFIERFARFDRQRGLRVLEVGIGAATDFARFARAGARLTGIDFTESAVRLARRRLALESLRAEVLRADAETLPMADASFDCVYSWGVIHHTGDTQRAADEIVRVTRAGGRVCVMIYHRLSLVALQCWIVHALLRGRPWRTLREVIAHHIESPGTRAYSIREARQMFATLANVTVTPVVTPYDARIARGRYLPAWLRRLIPRRLGWFLVVEGRKAA